MVLQWTSFLLITSVLINSGKRNLANEIIDIYETNVTLEWEDFSIYDNCKTRRTRNEALFKCPLPIGYFNILDKTCLNKKFLSFNEARCRSRTIFECEDENYIGLYCNITYNPCEMAKLCLNDGSCYPNNTLPSKYYCECQSGFSGDHCEIDHRICKNNTCWHDGNCLEKHEIIMNNDKVTFQCDCERGYDGRNCELVSNMCVDVTCENNGVCSSANLSWSCHCSSLFSGEYCQDKSTELVIKQALSKSFASVAITAIVTVFLFVIIMDVLKFGFGIDPVDRERQLMKSERRKKQFSKKLKIKKRRKIAWKLFHIS